VGYDIYNTIRDIVIEQTGSSQGKVITQGITGIAKNVTAVLNNSTQNILYNSTVSSLIETVSQTLVNNKIAQNVPTTVP
jgi:hypothetical protein